MANCENGTVPGAAPWAFACYRPKLCTVWRGPALVRMLKLHIHALGPRHATVRADLRKPFDARRDAYIRTAIGSETALGDV